MVPFSGTTLMAGEGEIAAAFRSLAGAAAQAGEKIGDSIGAFYSDTANGAEENVARTLGADEENARAFDAIRPQDPALPGGSDPAGGPGEGAGSRISRMLNGGDDGGPPRWGITKSLRSRYRGEEVNNWIWPGSAVKYLNESSRARYKLTVKDGKLYDAKGNLFDTSDATSLHSADDPRAIFVMDHDGNVYASKWQEEGRFHHSSFLAGGDVAGAGELKVSNGDLKLISNASGHYHPTQDMTIQVVKELQSRGLTISGDAEIQTITG